MRIEPGTPRPLGATLRDGGVNFSLFSSHATAVELLLFERPDGPPTQVIPLDPRDHRTFSYWHVFVPGLGDGQLYGYRVDGPHAPERGHTYRPNKLLLDPYARGIVYGVSPHDDALGEAPNLTTGMKSLVVDPDRYDWQGVRPPTIAPEERVIYEVHVRGFTRNPNSGVRWPGTFVGLVEKLPYLKDLGVTTIELLPVFQFDRHDIRYVNPDTGEALVNYWGYDPIGFFAPHRDYCIEGWENMRYLTDFRDMVRACHEAGIEVLLDVVYNHTAESDERGPTYSFRGLDNSVYYLLDPEDRSRYANYSGVGNTVSCNHPVVRRLILDSLRYWAGTMRVDGFRFDLAAILSRDTLGRPMADPPLPWEIEWDPVLDDTLLVAEAWDAAGLYQVGGFPGERWKEWNGQFRDDIRRFLRGDHGMVAKVAQRVMGSPDLYAAHGRYATQSINFVTCHDGFTLNDLVSYERRHNRANGEDNRDGAPENHSANYGVEGPTDDPRIEAVRARQVKNFLAMLLLSQGTPMLLGGDEMRRTQRGNNNAYCQDNGVSWFDWDLLDTHADTHRFTKSLLAFRRAHPNLRRRRYLEPWSADHPSDGRPRVRWHGTEVDTFDDAPWVRTLAWSLVDADDDDDLHIMVNAHVDPVAFALPEPRRGAWCRAIDTSRPSPDDIVEPGAEVPVGADRMELGPRSLVVLVDRRRYAPPRAPSAPRAGGGPCCGSPPCPWRGRPPSWSSA